MSRTKSPPPPAMAEIEAAAKLYADLRNQLDRCVATLKEGLRKVQDRHIDDLRATAAEIGAAHDALRALVEAHPELFVKPKSVALHGVRVGFKKEPGRIEFEDAAKVIERITKHVPEQLDTLAPQGPRSLSKTELAKLDAATIKRIGVTVTADEDTPFVKGPNEAIDKWVDSVVAAYIKEGA